MQDSYTFWKTIMANSRLSFTSLWQSLSQLYDLQESQAIVRLILDSLFGFTLTDIVCGGVEKLSAEQKERLESVMQRLKDGEPVQYVIGEAQFCGRNFRVGPGVLIPRPETEELCGMIVNDCRQITSLKAQSSELKAIDIGTGSGCIAITLALDIPNADVSATDVSEKALDIARSNADALNAKVRFIHQDILKVSHDKKDGNNDRFDCIVSNPPYISLKERKDMRANVLNYEPSTALFVPDDDPLLFYRAIADFAVNSLADNGGLYFEINPMFAGALKTLLSSKGFNHVDIITDSFGKQRFAKATL